MAAIAAAAACGSPVAASRAAPAWTAMALSWWATTSCSSRASLARSISCACRAAVAAVSRCALVISPMPSAMARSAQAIAGSWLPWSAGNVMKTASSAHAASARPARRTVLLP